MKNVISTFKYLESSYTDLFGNFPFILNENGADINAKDKDGETVLMYAARGGNTDIVNLLLDKGAKVNATDKKKLLKHAAAGGNAEIVDLLKKVLNKVSGEDDEK